MSWLAFRVATSVADLVRRQARVPAVGQPAEPSRRSPAPPPSAGKLCRVPGRARDSHSATRSLPARRSRESEQLSGLVRHVERAIRGPSRRPPYEADLVGPSGWPCAFCVSCLFGLPSRCGFEPRSGSAARPRARRRSPPRSRRRRCRPRPAARASHRPRTAPSTSSLNAHRRRPVELDAVVVVERRRACRGGGGRRASSASDATPSCRSPSRAMHVRPVVDDVVAGSVELRGEPALGDRHADRVARGPGRAGRSSPRRPASGRTRVARRVRAPLAERLEVLERDVVAGEVEQRVQQHRRVPGGEDEPVAVRPVRVVGAWRR